MLFGLMPFGSDQGLGSAVAAACALVVAVDGQLQPEERARVAECLRQAAADKGLDAAAVEAEFHKYFDKMVSSSGAGTYNNYIGEKPKMMAKILKVKRWPDKASFVVQTCRAIGQAGEGFSDHEKRVVFDICRDFGLDPAAFGY